jgi:hypothetical protein
LRPPPLPLRPGVRKWLLQFLWDRHRDCH